MMSLKGTKRLVRLALRRDRIVIPVTLLLVLLMVGGSAPALITTYPDKVAQATYVASSAPSIVGRMFQGTVSGVNLGSIMMAEVFLFTAVILAIMSMFIVSRHTRHNEETGSGELIGATEVGRNAPLTAALIVATGANVVAAVLNFAILASFEKLDIVGSLYLSVSLMLVGIFFAGIAAVTAQLSDYRRGANTLAIAILGVMFLVRGFGDALGKLSDDGLTVTASWLTWLSPLGWGYQVLPYNENRIMPLLLLCLAFAVVAGYAYYLLNIRDIGSSIFQAKSGRKRAGTSLLRAGGLARRLQRGSLVAWTVGFVVIGILYGVMVNDYRSLFEESDVFKELLAATGTGGNFSETIFAAMIAITAAFAAGFVVSGLSKMQDEEMSGRLEYLLGTALGRTKWIFTHIWFIVFGAFMIMGAMGLSSGIAYSVAAQNPDVTLLKIIITALINIPAILVFMSVVLLVFGLLGKYVRVVAWSYFAYCSLIGSLAGIFKWPQWVSNFSPFVHTPNYPAEAINLTPLLALSAVAIVLSVIGVIYFTRRDISLK